MSKKDKEQQAVEAEVVESQVVETGDYVVKNCLLYTSPSPRDA